MGTLVLIRHGQATYGEADYDRLSSRGEDQASALGAFLAEQRIDPVFAGPLRRQQETVAARREAAPACPSPTTLPELAEYPAFDMLQHFMPRLVAEDPQFAPADPAPTRAPANEAFHTILAQVVARRVGDATASSVSRQFAARVRARPRAGDPRAGAGGARSSR